MPSFVCDVAGCVVGFETLLECVEHERTHPTVVMDEVDIADVRTLMNRLVPRPDGGYSSDADTEAAFRRLYITLPPLSECSEPDCA